MPILNPLLIDCSIKGLKKLNKLQYQASHTCTDTAILTATKRSPKAHSTMVFKRTCIKAVMEKSLSRFSENEMTLLCFSISIPNVHPEDL